MASKLLIPETLFVIAIVALAISLFTTLKSFGPDKVLVYQFGDSGIDKVQMNMWSVSTDPAKANGKSISNFDNSSSLSYISSGAIKDTSETMASLWQAIDEGHANTCIQEALKLNLLDVTTEKLGFKKRGYTVAAAYITVIAVISAIVLLTASFVCYLRGVATVLSVPVIVLFAAAAGVSALASVVALGWLIPETRLGVAGYSDGESFEYLRNYCSNNQDPDNPNGGTKGFINDTIYFPDNSIDNKVLPRTLAKHSLGIGAWALVLSGVVSVLIVPATRFYRA